MRIYEHTNLRMTDLHFPGNRVQSAPLDRIVGKEMNYSQAIAYLYSLTDYEKIRIERYTPEEGGAKES